MSKSLSFAADLVYYSDRKVNHIISDWTYVDHDQLVNAFGQRLRKDLIGDQRDIFAEYPDSWRSILSQWNDKAAKMEYLKQLSRTNPACVGIVVASYVDPRQGVNGPRAVFLHPVESDWDVRGLLQLAAFLDQSASNSLPATQALQILREEWSKQNTGDPSKDP